MQLKDREAVSGTEEPIIYIGHRFHRDPTTGKIKVSKKWHAAYSHQARRLHEPLGTTNKAAAQRAAHVIHQRLQRGEQRKVQRRVEWDEIRDGYIEYVESLRRAPSTVKKYKQVLRDFIAVMKKPDPEKKAQPTRPDQITPKQFRDYGSQLSTGDGSVEDHLVVIKQMFKWATNESTPPLLLVNPIAKVKVEEAEDAPQPFFTPEQVAKLLAEADDHHRPIWAVMAYLGLRFGEVRDLLWSDFNFSQGDNGWVHIRRGGSVQKGGLSKKTKGKRSRRIPLNKELRNILLALPRHEDGRLFHQQPCEKYPNGGRPLNGDRLLKSLKRLCKRCGFENPSQYKQHTFRHSFASMLARNNVSYKYALEFMGHKSSDILDLYYNMFDKTAESAIAGIQYDLNPLTENMAVAAP